MRVRRAPRRTAVIHRFCSRVVIWVVIWVIWAWRVLACCVAICHCSAVVVWSSMGDMLLAFMMMFFEEGEFEFADGAAFD